MSFLQILKKIGKVFLISCAIVLGVATFLFIIVLLCQLGMFIEKTYGGLALAAYALFTFVFTMGLAIAFDSDNDDEAW